MLEKMSDATNIHHPTFPKALHTVYKPNKEIRAKTAVEVDEEAHKELHRNIGMVAVLSYSMANSINNKMKGYYVDGREAIEDLEGYTMDAIQSNRYHSEDEEIAIQVLNALYKQWRYID